MLPEGVCDEPGEMEGDVLDGEILAETRDVLGGADLFDEDGILARTLTQLFVACE